MGNLIISLNLMFTIDSQTDIYSFILRKQMITEIPISKSYCKNIMVSHY